MIELIPEQEINKIIAKQIQQFGQIHFLIDPQINDNFFWEHNVEFDSIVPIRDRQDTVSSDHECLQLCTIKKGSADINPLVAELKNNQTSLIALIASPYTIKDIQQHISNAMFMSYQANYFILRFYDPQVLRHLVNIFDKQQISKMLGCVQYWYYWQDNYVQLHHKPELILWDINYKITTIQWQQIKIAQHYNAYEHQTVKKQKKPLTNNQKSTLWQLLDWIYTVTFNKPDQQKMDYIVNYSMVKSEHVFQQIDHDLFINLIRNQTVSQLEQYFNSLDKEHEDASN
ncbi:hypothetical protein A9G09_08070 [Gilliamella sp. wkB292]|uniref:DUF4123 domain-containing protein n=1 Tax=Gilliamella sp. wkB292 TaxID=3120262 RepID=UPI00080E6745|nr:DUF4123 domain-containing protein [Gilliamella apicola]OCG13144.1 hypothetical protein A9G09_08070 [Gilliamella apicola]